MSSKPANFEVYFSTTKIQDVLCPLCGAKRFQVQSRQNGEWDVSCKGKKFQKYDEEMKYMRWTHNFCPWNMRLSKGDFVRAAIAKSDAAAKEAIKLRERQRGKSEQQLEKKRGRPTAAEREARDLLLQVSHLGRDAGEEVSVSHSDIGSSSVSTLDGRAGQQE